MAFNKRLWKGRQGTGLNKFSINGATPVTVINQPDSVTEQGDALSAGNLNDLEDRIYDAFEDIADGTQVVGKATADASGNVITTTYETKADASDLKSAIDNNSQRIENLEVAVSGSLVQTNVLTDPPSMANVRTITNANSILPWAILKRVGARAVSWNQLCPKFTARTVVVGDVTWTIDEDGVVSATWSNTLSGNSTFSIFGSSDAWGASIPQGHKFLVGNKPSNTATQIRFAFYDTDGNTLMDTGITNADSQRIFTLQNGDAVKLYYALRIVANTPAGTAKFYPQFFNLTSMGMDSLTADQFRSLFPASYYPYTSNPSIIPLNPSAFKVVGKQNFDGVMELGDIDASTGADSYNNSLLRTKNYIPISYLEYCLSCSAMSGNNVRARFYDENNNYLGSTAEGGVILWNSGFKPLPNARYMRFTMSLGYGTTYNNDVLLCLNSVTDKSYEAYSETTIDTSFTSDYKYVNENCHDYSENVLVGGQKMREEHRIVGYVDLSEIAFLYDSGSSLYYKNNALPDAKLPSNSHDIAVMISDKYTPVSDYDVASSTEAVSIGTTGQLCVKSSSTPSGKLYYALDAEPTPTLHDPIPNFPSEDGTTITAITPQTDLVNAIDVPSTIAYMTKITS